MRRTVVVLTLILAAAALPPAGAQDEGPASEAELLAEGLDIPVDLTFGPDGALYFAELATGNVRALLPNGTPTDVLINVSSYHAGNGGFTGLAADPEEPGVFFAYYSMNKTGTENDRVNRVVKLNLTSGEEQVLVDDIRWDALHEGGRVLVAPDGYVYVTVGDTDLRDPAQDNESILGKVLRMQKTGEPVTDNPEGWHPLAYAKGFRNPFGITAAPDGTIYVSDNGGDEELNRLEKGANYGWPECTGDCPGDEYTDPVGWWDDHFGPTGVAVYGDTVYVGDYARSQILTVDVNTGETGVFWHEGGFMALDVEVGPDGCLYASGWQSIWRFSLDDATCALVEPDVKVDGGGVGGPGDGNTDRNGSGDGDGNYTPPTGDVDETPGPGAVAALCAAALGAAWARRRRAA